MNYIENGIVRSRVENDKSTFILISYYWGEDVVNKGSIYKLTYGQQVSRLINDCEKLNVNYYFMRAVSFEKSGEYQTALSYKTNFIKYCLDKFPKYKCIFIDTDLRLLSYPHLFDIDADCYFINWNEYDTYCYNPLQLVLPGAMLGFANTFNSRALLALLDKHIRAKPHLAEDKTFSGIITRNFLNVYLRCVWLPENYLYMFTKHKYDPKQGKYTYIASYEKELSGRSKFRIQDLVFTHEDFETGDLDDIYETRVVRERMPSKFYKQAGEKLRCFKIKFKNYMNFGMNNEQIKHYMPDWRSKQSDKLIINKMIKHIVDDKIENVKLKLKGDFDSPFYIVSLIDDSTYVDTLDDFIESCEKFKLSYRIYKQEKDGVNLPLFFHKLLNTLNKPIRFIPIDTVIKNKPEMMYINNMDLITYNANTIYSLSKCYDPRILKMVNNTYFLDNNQVVLDFLSIWAEYNKKAFIKENKQHKSFEYSFNITNAVNKLRCFWLPKQNLKTLDEYNNYLGLRKEIKHTTSQLEQCGKKPNIDDDLEPVKAHMYGSKRGANSRDIYSKQFITFF